MATKRHRRFPDGGQPTVDAVRRGLKRWHPRNLTRQDLLKFVWAGAGLFLLSVVVLVITMLSLYTLVGRGATSVTWQYPATHLANAGLVLGASLAGAAGVALGFLNAKAAKK